MTSTEYLERDYKEKLTGCKRDWIGNGGRKIVSGEKKANGHKNDKENKNGCLQESRKYLKKGKNTKNEFN